MTVGLGDAVALLAALVLAFCIARPRLGNVVAVRVTLWSGSLGFLLVHVVLWWAWTRFFEAKPYELLTMILSLEAIVLSTVTMLGLNLLSKQQAQSGSGRAELVRLVHLEHQMTECLDFARASEVWSQQFDNRLADLQERADDQH